MKKFLTFKLKEKGREVSVNLENLLIIECIEKEKKICFYVRDDGQPFSCTPKYFKATKKMLKNLLLKNED